MVLDKTLMVVGGSILLAGLLLYAKDHVPLIGKLPGDLLINISGLRVYLPISSFLLVSIVLTIVFSLIKK